MNSRAVRNNSFFHRRLQRFVANLLFPSGKGDWYKLKGYDKNADGTTAESPFYHFIQEQKTSKSSHYYNFFQHLNFKLKHLESVLADGTTCELEVMQCTPEDSLFDTDSPDRAPGVLAGKGKHIVYFPGAATYYQACFRDITTAAKETGATIHAFNFPGTGSSTGQVKEAKDLINAGIAVVNSLILKGVSPDDIILQGDCYGAAIAHAVKKEYKSQSDIDLRIIMNNSFKSFKAAVYDMISSSKWLPSKLKSIVKTLLVYTGWHVTPGKDYKFAGPYQCHIQHMGDQSLITSTLSSKVEKYTNESKTGKTSSTKRHYVEDTCPAEYLESRDRLDSKHFVRVKAQAKQRLEKWGKNQYGQVNAHFADVCELETLAGKSVYSDFICDFIASSDKYIRNGHQQTFNVERDSLPQPLTDSREARDITREEADDLCDLIDLLQQNSEESQPEVSTGDAESLCLR